MSIRSLALLFTLSRLALHAQDLPGPPKNPEWFSGTYFINQRNLDAEPKSARGKIAELHREEFLYHPNNPSAGPVLVLSTITKFDAAGHDIDQTIVPQKGQTSHRVSTYQNGILDNQETDYSDHGKKAGQNSYTRYRHDSRGRVTDIKRGRGLVLDNHHTAFRYDPQDRLLGFDYHQGEKDELFSRTQIKYAGNVVDTTVVAANDKPVSRQVQQLDPGGRVTDLRVYRESTPFYHCRFVYDFVSRIVLQETDDYDFPEGQERLPIPGRVVTEYDDAAHSRKQSLFDNQGKLALRSEAKLDLAGNVASIRVFDPKGEEHPPSIPFTDPAAFKPEQRVGRILWETDFDKEGNWTERRRWFFPAAGGPRVPMKVERQTIRYRAS